MRKLTGLNLDVQKDTFIKVLRFAWNYWRRQPVRIFLTFLFITIATSADIFTPIFAGALVDAMSAGTTAFNSSRTAVTNAFLMLAALGIVGVVCRQIAYTNIAFLTARMMREMAADGAHRLQRFSTAWHANNFSGSSVRKVTRAIWALDALNDSVIAVLFPALVMLVGTTLVFSFLWPILGVALAVGSVLFILLAAVLSIAYVAPTGSLANHWDSKLGGALADSVSCNAIVKSFGAETREDEHIGKILTKWEKRTLRTWMRSNISGLTQGISMFALKLLVLGLVVWLWRYGRATAGNLTFVLTAFFLLEGYLRNIGREIRNLQRSVNDMEELAELNRAHLGIIDHPTATPIVISKGGIDFERVGFRYPSQEQALFRNLSVSVRPNERVGLVGPSGSGKSTFVKLIQRLYDVDSGSINIDEQDISRVTQEVLRQQIALVPQDPLLFHRSIGENIAYGQLRATQEEIEHAAKLANAHDFILALPKGYNTIVGERGVKLSGGERQRIAIARAFLANTPMLILDEATSSLDSVAEKLIQKAMERLMIGRTTLVIAHRLSTVSKLDRLLVFSKGQIVEDGTHAELILKSCGVYRELFENQAFE